MSHFALAGTNSAESHLLVLLWLEPMFEREQPRGDDHGGRK